MKFVIFCAALIGGAAADGIRASNHQKERKLPFGPPQTTPAEDVYTVTVDGQVFGNFAVIDATGIADASAWHNYGGASANTPTDATGCDLDHYNDNQVA